MIENKEFSPISEKEKLTIHTVDAIGMLEEKDKFTFIKEQLQFFLENLNKNPNKLFLLECFDKILKNLIPKFSRPAEVSTEDREIYDMILDLNRDCMKYIEKTFK